MCGISGIYAYGHAADPVDRAELLRIRDHMLARGPDGKGEWYSDDQRVGFGHRRLSIIDLSEAGAQPMASVDGKLVITFNGEIYNYSEIKRMLEAKGHVFRSRSDTEVLLHLYAEKGEAMVHELRGMFAFAIWETDRRRLFLARDPYGIKPLYYADDGRTFRFASQVKALLAGGKISRDPEPAGKVGFYLWGSVPEPYTSYLVIRALPAGSTLLSNQIGAHEPRRYSSIGQVYCDAEVQGRSRANIGAREAQLEIRGALLDSVRHHLVADVPVGAFLSAGIDSGSLVGLMRDAGQEQIETVTLAFEEFRGKHDDEAPLAAKVAAQYSARHTTRIVTESEFRADLPRILEAMDQPSIDGINTWFVSKAARELGLKVAVSGLGGDELFAGYSSFHDIPRWVRWTALPSRIPFLGDIFKRAFSALMPFSTKLPPKAAGLLKYGGDYAGAYLLRRGLFMPWELEAVLDAGVAREGLAKLQPLDHISATLRPEPSSPLAKVAVLESANYMRNQLLRDSDWASMAHGLELRVPLVDFALLKSVAGGVLSSNLANRKTLLAMAPRQPLMQVARQRLKTGFATPVDSWLQRSLATQQWRRNPALVGAGYPWARRWAYEVAAA